MRKKHAKTLAADESDGRTEEQGSKKAPFPELSPVAGARYMNDFLRPRSGSRKCLPCARRRTSIVASPVLAHDRVFGLARSAGLLLPGGGGDRSQVVVLVQRVAGTTNVDSLSREQVQDVYDALERPIAGLPAKRTA